MSLAIGVDIGGTKVAAGVVDENGTVLDRERRDTPGNDVEQTESTIVAVVTTLAARPDVSAVGIGAGAPPPRRQRGRNGGGRLDRQRPRDRRLLPAPGLAQRAAAGGAGGPHRA